MKDVVVATCKQEYGHRAILKIFQSVDDTILIKKYILQVF